jgi:hypothetical protein
MGGQFGWVTKNPGTMGESKPGIGFRASPQWFKSFGYFFYHQVVVRIDTNVGGYP